MSLAGVSENACLKSGRRDNASFGKCGAKTPKFFVGKEESLVFLNRPADRIAELIAHERILAAILGEEILGRERGVAPEPIDIRLKIVRAAFRDNVDDGAIVAAELGQIIVGEYAEFLCNLRIQNAEAGGESRHVRVIIVRTIEHEIVAALARAVHRESAEKRVGLRNAGGKQHKLIGIAQNQGQILDLAAADEVADLGVI